MKIKKQLLLLLCTLLFGTAQAQVQDFFEYPDLESRPSHIIKTSDGYVMTTHRSIVKIDENGQLMWESTEYYQNAFGYVSPAPNSLVELENGNLQILYDGGNGTFLVNLTSSGGYINHFTAKENIPGYYWEALRDDNGDYYFLDYTEEVGKRKLVKLNDQLELQWETEIPGIVANLGGNRFYMDDAGILTFLVHDHIKMHNYSDLFRYRIDSNTGSILEETFLQEMDRYTTYLSQPNDDSYYLISGEINDIESVSIKIDKYNSVDELVNETSILGSSLLDSSYFVSIPNPLYRIEPLSMSIMPNGNIALTVKFSEYSGAGTFQPVYHTQALYVLNADGEVIDRSLIKADYDFLSSSLLALCNNQVLVGGRKNGNVALMLWGVPECDCPTEINPVCGSDGNEYDNACLAECEGVNWTDGPCQGSNIANTPYVWLNDLLNSQDCCSANKATLYDFGYYGFIFVSSDDSGNCGFGTLYDKQGELYCTSFESFNCIGLYDLSDGVELWSCDEVIDCICTDEYDPVCGSDGVEYSNSCMAACQGVTWTAGSCDDNNNIPNTPYSWLNDLLNSQDCCSANKATLYRSGVHDFIFISAEDSGNCGIGALYYGDGLFYCNSTSSYDCVALYGLTKVSLLWSCDGENSPSNECNYEHKGRVFIDVHDGESYFLIELLNGQILDPYLPDGVSFDFNAAAGHLVSFSYTNSSFNSPCNFDATAVDLICIQDEDLPVSNFDDYPWLENIVNESDCCSAYEIYEYTNGVNFYIYVVPESSCGVYPMMYNSVGQFYCQSSAGYNCLALYGITAWETNLLYICTEKSDRIVGANLNENLNENVLDVSVYPNPSSGIFYLKYLSDFDENNTIIHVYDKGGKLILEQSINEINAIDLSGFSTGLYVLKLTSYQGTVVKKLIVE